MEIKDELVLNGMNWASAYNIENSTIGAFKTSDSNTPGYYIVWWTGNAYTLQEQYTCHALDPPVIIPEGELFFPVKFMTQMRKTPYWYHEPDEAIHVMVKLKQVVMTYIELIQEKIQKINCHHVLKHTLIWNLIYYLKTIIKSYWVKLKQEKILTMMNMCKMKITTM